MRSLIGSKDDSELIGLKAKIGAVTMTNELLRQKNILNELADARLTPENHYYFIAVFKKENVPSKMPFDYEVYGEKS